MIPGGQPVDQTKGGSFPAVIPQKGGYTGITNDIQPGYFLQHVKCGSRTQSQTVMNWLEQFGIPLEDEFYSLWTSIIIFISEFFTGLEAQKRPEYIIERLWDATFSILYLQYDTESDFLPQFRDRVLEIKKILAQLKDRADELMESKADGE